MWHFPFVLINVIKIDFKIILNELIKFYLEVSQFRNLHAIYFINDYIQTSNESLSSAFLHLDLDYIKTKLDTIIQQQRTIILQMAIQQSQNEAILNLNQTMMKQLKNIEKNTSVSAQYSKIAAINTKKCAWFSRALYFQNYYNK